MSNYKFVLSSDNTGDIKKSYFEQHKIEYILCGYILKGEDIRRVLDSDAEFYAFYDSIKKGALPTTTAINPTEFEEHFKGIMEKSSQPIIHIGLSSGLSLTHQNAVSAADEINKALGEVRIHVIDTFAASGVIDKLVDEVRKVRDKGGTIDEAVRYVNEIKSCVQGWIIVDDLKHLKRGGRISGVKAAIGNLLGIKPIIMINAKGKLAIENKQRGMKRAIEYIIGKYKELSDEKYKHISLRIIHSSTQEEVEEFKKAIWAYQPNLEIEASIIGPVIGVHVGSGILGLVFIGKPTLLIE